ncbi:unnamed protein product [Vicia faba]|uniref:Reverse transcriptase domain-containing protein n=1 Tax=Vicia faba TaxID=3906 RepID=A0AAV1B7U6_VICFA|nr:unnamed protein product [Vicia faba]
MNWSFLLYISKRYGFRARWIRWMEACVCHCSLSVLVNSSRKKDFPMGKGLRQGDPLSPFLFTLVAEGLEKLLSKAITCGLYKGFRLSNSVEFHMLQFADDTIIIGEGSWSNLWSIKAVLRGFELVSGLNINFSKSCLVGINLRQRFM